uniref:Uncharacterized protein n=1 Tax=viral metagenome TaxID=1070528 RepID=A0A6C0LIJ3_9ZZZZ
MPEPYYGCDCIVDEHMSLVSQCVGCSGNVSNPEEEQKINQKRQWGLVRTSSSMFISNLSAVTVRGTSKNDTKSLYYGVNWNQMSDRAVPSVIPTTMNVPRNRTRHRPGASGSGGVNANGVDVKHDSYARYLARKKSKVLYTYNPSSLPTPLQGNKQYSLGMIANCQCPDSL